MRSAVYSFGLTLITSLFSAVGAQQYAGTTIPNSLPAVSNGAVSYFNINASGKSTTLINYFSAPNGTKQNALNVQRAIIVLHGANRDPWNYFNDMHAAMLNASKYYNSEISDESVAIMAPYFANEADAGVGYPVNTSAPAGEQSTTNVLIWSGTGWNAGQNTIEPTGVTVSSFTALDQAVEYFANPLVYPNMKQIVVAGHSMGAQMSQRYSVIGTPLSITVPILYWIGNPDSFAWLNSSRPVAPGTCTTYDDWEWGLSNYTETQTYNQGIVALGVGAVQSNLAAKNVAYARGLNDHGDYGEGCDPYSQGADRGARFLNFMTYFPPDSKCTVDYYPGVGHNDLEMFGQEPGSYRLFLDNWNGDGTKAADFGPRQVTGDNPHPNATTFGLRKREHWLTFKREH